MAGPDDFEEDFGNVDFESNFGEEKPVAGDKPSLKEIWDTNPALKLIAGALGVVIAVVGFTVFMPESDAQQGKALLSVGGTSNIKHVPGQEELDPAYKKALEETNKRAAEAAMQSGGSALPTPVGVSKQEQLNVAQMPEKPKADPLAEWRKATETRRKNVDAILPQEEAGGLEPDVVPVVQPIQPKAAQLQRDPEASRRLADQMRVIVAAQEPADMKQEIITFQKAAYIRQLEQGADAAKTYVDRNGVVRANEQTIGKGNQPVDGMGNAAVVQEDKVIIPAGSVSYAQVTNELNSDVPGPVLATILSGPFAGGRAIGEFKVENEYMVLSFKRVVKDAVSYTVDGVAMDEKSTLTGMSTDVERHYLTRVILPAAAKFIEGYSSARSERSSTTTTGAGGSTVTDKPKATSQEATQEGVAEAGKKLAEIVEEDGDRPITVKVARGTTFGILFLETVTTGNIE